MNKTYNTAPKSAKTNLEWMGSDNGYPKQLKTVATSVPEAQQNVFAPPKNVRQASPEVLGTLFPGTMSGFAKNPNTAAL